MRSSRRSLRSRRTGTKGGSEAAGGQAKVFDEHGTDVTPKPLGGAHMQRPSFGPRSTAGTESEGGGRMSRSSARRSENMSRASGAPSARDSSGSVGSLPTDIGDDDAISTASSDQQDAEEEEQQKQEKEKRDKAKRSDEQLKQVKGSILVPSREGRISEQELEREVAVELVETDTIWLLNNPSVTFHLESPDADDEEAAISRSVSLSLPSFGQKCDEWALRLIECECGVRYGGMSRYKKKLDEYRSAERLADGWAQTLNPLNKVKEVVTASRDMQERGAQANPWDAYDKTETVQYEGGEEMVQIGELPNTSISMASPVRESRSTTNSSQQPRMTMTSTQQDAMPRASGMSTSQTEGSHSDELGLTSESLEETDPIKRMKDLPKALEMMEKAVAQNAYYERLLMYHDFRTEQVQSLLQSSSPSEGSGQRMVHLWDFASPVTEGRNVSCMTWNKVKRDVLAVGYGQLHFDKDADGMICVWSLRNPASPKLAIRTTFGVTALDFAEEAPSLLAVGFYNGSVAIYDVRSVAKEPIMESGHSSGQHSDPVWKLQWVRQSNGQGENMVSISTDGRVTSWTIRKGLEYTDLMELKRHNTRENGAFISRYSSGMCFDFRPGDSNIYLAGTEDGAVHKCSCSYKEQYLQSYLSHSGPVYSAKWSPFRDSARNRPDLFLTAAADWTVKLWEDEGSPALLMTFQSGNEEVTDMSWSPTASTVFGTTTRDGRVEVWDISKSTLHPSISDKFEGERLNCLLFSDSSPVLVCGGSSSCVHVYRLGGVHRPNASFEEQDESLEEAMRNNIMSGPKTGGK